MIRLKMCVLILFLMPLQMLVAQEKKVIIIDAGHGGTDSGAIGNNHIKEKDITLSIAKAMLVFNTKVLNCKYDMYMTRYTDTLISLSHRTKLARVLKPDLFISIHCNHAPNKRATGIEVFLHRYTPMKNPNQKESNRIAISILDELTQKLGYRSRGVKTANFQVLRETVQTCPTILVELGFLSNIDEADYLKKKENINALALAVLMPIKL
ncbi:N-acetylmuramoyl-L-alanine amidase [Croceitalea sp. MTPC5]|uniref:N-acetylmuramoyl-L-alanine amidase family protein n=1 Tax=Croceitalea sp. MTPC5 TaxID=3056565 RepID=UPI002B3F6166|nr:N-acetylmuramoyl-L-alanine amidase [Croceitalea sp. MTPC5]